ncbi:hypothetical protein ACJIZ3_004276 [Penstemon smallii]|uniref:RING-type domain-containing protein n=1 Tax=Penstemon smallii TaxID=265156 RepID=A0ABD3S1L8_9LAMI
MGLSSSKQNAPPSSSGARTRSRSNSTSTVLKSSCLGSHQSDNDDPQPQVSDSPSEENCNTLSHSTANKSSSCEVSGKCYNTDEAEQSDDTNCIASDIELEEWAESRFNGTVSRDVNTSPRALSSRSLNPPNSRFLSRFSFYPGNLSFRLTRSNSLDPTRVHSRALTSHRVSNKEEEYPNRHERPQGCDFFPGCFANRSSRTRHEQPGNPSGDFSDNLQDNREINVGSSISHIESDEIRHGNRHFAAREPTERNVRFSRTLSVGRLRDRVLRRAHVPDLDLYRFQQDREVTRTQGLGHATVEATSENDSISNPFYGSQNQAHETPRVRETRYRDLLEHRSNFLERRRRIRSQVRALQRLGSRFENLSSRERSCILSGQHQSGHCACHIAAREVNSNDDANARASISRIVVLAEALFEVLDEIHQQSVVLSSRPSVSSIGSIPASNEVVDSLPSKLFSKLKRKTSEEAAQCYICLVEYEEGDSMRILPCHHEFHRVCVDKWLKEVHRVCPLCRGDICRPESLTAGN